MHSETPEVAVGAVALREGALLLVRRGRPPSEGRWSLPGGRVEWGEPLAAALRREVEEETGLVVEPAGAAGVVERVGEGFHYVIVDYFVTVTGGALRAGGDATAAEWVLLADLAERPLAPGLLDSLRDFGVPGV